MLTIPMVPDGGCMTLGNGKIIALGLNYMEHVRETGRDVPAEPVLFSKTPNVLIGDGGDIIVPASLRDELGDALNLHYEAELAVVIGRRASRVTAADADEFILGYTCFNDVSLRNYQFADQSGWFRGKSLDTFGPVGPCIVRREAIADPHALEIRCGLNGRTVQSASTAEMIFRIPVVIEFITRHITLEPGDIIATGTPSGVGPMSHGDLVEVEIEGIGILSNRVREEGAG